MKFMSLNFFGVKKFTLFLAFFAIFFTACASKNEAISEPPNVDLNEDIKINEWWREYQNATLNKIISLMLENNAEIAVAQYNFLTAVSRYKLINFDLYPTLTGNLGASLARDLNLGERSNAFSNSLNLSYELDIYGKVRDEKSAAQFSAKASEYELESLKLSLINSTIDNVFELIYFNDVAKLLEEYIQNLEESHRIYALKYELGRVEELDLLNIEQSLLNAKQSLLSNAQNKELVVKNLKDLLGKNENFKVLDKLDEFTLGDFKELPVDFNISLDILANRPDVKAQAASLNSAFKDYKSMQKSMFPSITLGGSLSGSDKELGQSFKLLNLGGSLQISLPFLDYGRVKQNVQISRFSYESLKANYAQTLQSAINEFYSCFLDFEFNTKLYENIKAINDKQALITAAYLQKYEYGRTELKDYLDAKNSHINSSQEILRSRLNLLQTINNYYKILGDYEKVE